MKRILAYADLSPAFQREAIAKISRLGDLAARTRGEIWAEPSRDLAEAATYEMSIRAGQYTGIWAVRLPRSPRLQPGTEFRRITPIAA